MEQHPREPAERIRALLDQVWAFLKRLGRTVFQVGEDWVDQQARPPAPPEEEIARWITLLAHPDNPAHARALDELVVIGRAAIPALIDALHGESWIQVFRAGEALGLIGDRRAVRPLLRLLDHPNSNVRWGAAEALGRLQSRWARGPLNRAASGDESRTSWGEPVSEAAERAVANIDRTWVSRLLTVIQIVVLLAACAAIVLVAAQIVRRQLEQAPQETPTVVVTETATPTPTRTPSPTPVPTMEPIPAVIDGQTANVREMPNLDAVIIGVLHYGDEITLYGGVVDEDGAWWYLMRLARINNPATQSEVLEGGAYGWIHSGLVAGVESLEIAPTVSAVETMQAAEATPTPIGSSLELPPPTPLPSETATPTP